MGDFRAISPPIQIFDSEGDAHTVVGWYSLSGDWYDMQPVVGDPDGINGVRPWSYYHGEDHWALDALG